MGLIEELVYVVLKRLLNPAATLRSSNGRIAPSSM